MRLVKSINVEEKLNSVTYGSGTFAEIVDKVYDGTIYALTNNAGNVIGLNYETGLSGVEDSFAKEEFTRRYAGKPIMQWVLKAFELYMAGTIIYKVNEDGDDVSVVTVNGEEIIVSKAYHYNNYNNDPELPSDVELSLEDDLDDDASFSSVRNYLKKEYGYCLARGIQPEIEVDGDTVNVNGIEWGRKLSDSEYAAL